MVNKCNFIINHLVCLGDTKDPLCLSLSVASHHFSHKSNDHDVEPSRGRSSLTTGPIHPTNPPLPSPHRRPSPWRVLRTNQTCLCPPLAGEVSNASRHPPAAPCTFGRGCPSSCCAHHPRALFCRAFPLNSVSRNPRLHCRGPTPSTRPLGNYPHLSLRLPLPPCRRTNFHKHTTINGGLVCLYLCLSCLDLCLILICFVLFD